MSKPRWGQRGEAKRQYKIERINYEENKREEAKHMTTSDQLYKWLSNLLLRAQNDFSLVIRECS
jgi:hypothetical protein